MTQSIDTFHDTSGISSVSYFLYQQLSRQLPRAANDWLAQAITKLWNSEQALAVAFSSVPRYLGKANLKTDLAAQQQARLLCPGWQIEHWSVDQAARALLLLACLENETLEHDDHLHLKKVQQLLDHADFSERVALYQCLPLLPAPQNYLEVAVDGLRSSMTAVFNAIALRNPYPARYFGRSAWNQLVLKALFEASPLSLIYALEQRANPQLSKMLVDYAHERWAAGRTIDPELWRAVGHFATEEIAVDLARVLKGEDEVACRAAALACDRSTVTQSLLAEHPQLAQAVRAGQLTWNNFRTYSLVTCDNV